MKYELPKHLKLTKKEKKEMSEARANMKKFFIKGLLIGALFFIAIKLYFLFH